MAMTKCKECKKEVSTEAEKCPHCGIDRPGVTKKKRKILRNLAWFAGAWILLAFIVGKDGANSDGGAGAPVEQAVAESAPAARPPEQVVSQEVAVVQDKPAPEPAVDEGAACQQDIVCWAEKGISAATVYCKEAVEKMAQYSSKWTDGFLDPKLSRYRWADKEQGHVTYIGDKIQFQNGFGAFQNHVYQCDFDPKTRTVLDVRAQPGHLPS